MPILIRIILQRLLILLYSFLAFLGISPEASIPTEEEARIAIEQRQDAVVEFFEDEENQERIDGIIEGGKRVVEELEKIEVKVPKKTNVDLEDINIQQPEENNSDEANIEPEDQTSISEVEDVVVNIVCSQDHGSFINVSTGSGVIVDPKGIILTNAHVGQFVLLEDYSRSNSSMECAVYKEKIPTLGYNVDVLYISPDWIEENANLIDAASPRGTGEYDYAFLYITGSTNPAIKKPREFPYVEISLLDNNYETGKNVTVAGFPGAPQNIVDIASAGFLKKEKVEIEDVYTFENGNIDIFSTENSKVGARGASGGGVFLNNELIGIISTTNGEQNNAKINALTTTYINSDLKDKTGDDIDDLLGKGSPNSVRDFSIDFGYTLADILFEELQ
jgi:hypothetical protein